MEDIWLLVDYDYTGLWQIQARDDHPRRAAITDEHAIVQARLDAVTCSVARDAVAKHDRDAPAIELYRSSIPVF